MLYKSINMMNLKNKMLSKEAIKDYSMILFIVFKKCASLNSALFKDKSIGDKNCKEKQEVNNRNFRIRFSLRG